MRLKTSLRSFVFIWRGRCLLLGRNSSQMSDDYLKKCSSLNNASGTSGASENFTGGTFTAGHISRDVGRLRRREQNTPTAHMSL